MEYNGKQWNTKDTPPLQHYKIYRKEAFFLYVVFKRLMLLGKSKASTKKLLHDDEIHIEILKRNVNFFTQCISIFYSNEITIFKFHSFLKMTNVIPIFK